MKRIIVYSLATILFASCQTKNVTEAERFDASVRKELPFAGTSLAKRLLGVDIPCRLADGRRPVLLGRYERPQ